MSLTRIFNKKSRSFICFMTLKLSNHITCNYFHYFHSNTINCYPRGIIFSRTSKTSLENINDFSNENFEFLERDNDALGIESDEGAIYFEKELTIDLDKFSNLFHHSNKTNEIVSDTSFGQIRRDIDNPPRHRSPASKIVFNTSLENTSLPSNEKLINILKFKDKNPVSENELPTKKTHELSLDPKSQESNSSKHLVDEDEKIQVNNKTSSSGMDNGKIIGSSYFEEQCFKEQYINTSATSDNFNKSEINKDNKTEINKENLINENFNSQITEINVKANDFLQDTARDLNYIDQCYFHNEDHVSHNNNLPFQNNTASENISNEINGTVSDILDSTPSNFIDEIYLNNLQGKTDSNEYPIFDKQSLDSHANILSNKINQKYESFISETESTHHKISNSRNNSHQAVKIIDGTSRNEITELHRDTNINKFMKFNFKFEIDEHLRNNTESFLESKMETDRNIFSHSDIETSIQSKHLQHVKDSVTEDITNVKMFEEMSDKPVKEEKTLQKQNETAMNYVLKLKKATKVRSDILKDGDLTKITGEKLDSKGFRILKNQVPDLSKLTHEELLAVLKNRVVYQNDDLLVLNKPYNLVVHDAKSNKEPSLSNLLDDLARHFDKKSPNPKLYTVHRLDKETTGCLLLARNELIADHIKALFAQRKIVKMYWVVTSKVPDPLEGIIDIPIAEGKVGDKTRMVLSPRIPEDMPYKSHAKNGKQAISHYRVISISGNAALVEVRPETGIKHQIRVHFGFGLGCPIIGDHKYSHLDKLAPQKLQSDLLQRLRVRQSKVRYIPMHIHARSIIIPGLLQGRNVVAYCPLPEHMASNLRSLRFRKK